MSSAMIPLIILLIVIVGLINKVKIFDLFTDGVKEGLHIIFDLFPVFLGLFLAVSILRVSGIISLFSGIVAPFLKIFKIPEELIGIIALKPLSGSASLAIFTEIVNEYDANSLITFIAAVVMGSSETLMYSIAIYSGSIEKKMSYKVIILAIFGEILAILLASFWGRVFFY